MISLTVTAVAVLFVWLWFLRQVRDRRVTNYFEYVASALYGFPVVVSDMVPDNMLYLIAWEGQKRVVMSKTGYDAIRRHHGNT